MAERLEGSLRQRLECPQCRDLFKEPTLLQCGHTVCMPCLEASATLTDVDPVTTCVTCPQCPAVTTLTADGLDGLPKNLFVMALIEEYNSRSRSDLQESCSLHVGSDKNIFCQDCNMLICPQCIVSDHLYHNFERRKDAGEKIKAKIQKCNSQYGELKDLLQHNSDKEKVAIEERETMLALQRLREEITEARKKKMDIMRKNEMSLLQNVDEIPRLLRDKCISSKDDQCLKEINRLMAKIPVSSIFLEGDQVGEHNKACDRLDILLGKQIDKQRTERVSVLVKEVKFISTDSTLLALGKLDVPGMPLSSSLQSLDQPERLRQRKHILELIETVPLSASVCGMTTLSDDKVAVGFGGLGMGSDAIGVSGEISQHLKEDVGWVGDMAVLTDGRIAVSKSSNSIKVYNRENSATESTFTCPDKLGYFCSVDVDQTDLIFAVNGKPEIFVFKVGQEQPRSIIQTGHVTPLQINVTRAGLLVTSTCRFKPSTVSVYDVDGDVGSSIVASEDNELLYAAVDTDDRVFIARVVGGSESDVVNVTRYSIVRMELTEVVKYEELRLPEHLENPSNSYMVCFARNYLAFACGRSLFLIKIP